MQGLEQFYSGFPFNTNQPWPGLSKGESKTSKKPKLLRVKHSSLEKQQSIKWYKDQIKLPGEFPLLLLLLVFFFIIFLIKYSEYRQK